MESKTYSQLQTLKSSNGLSTDDIYFISDKGIYISAVNSNSFNSEAMRDMLCANHSVPSYVTGAIGKIWCPLFGITVAIGEKKVWGGNTWVNLTGDIGYATDDFWLDTTNWKLVDIVEGDDYTLTKFNIVYDFDNDLVISQKDMFDNEVGPISLQDVSDLGYNPCDYTDWLALNYTLTVKNNGFTYGFFNNYSKIDLEAKIINNKSLTIMSCSLSPNTGEPCEISNNDGTFGARALKNVQCIQQIIGNNISDVSNNTMTDTDSFMLIIQGNKTGIGVVMTGNVDTQSVTYNKNDVLIRNCTDVKAVDYNENIQFDTVENLKKVTFCNNIQVFSKTYPANSELTYVNNTGKSIQLSNALSLDNITVDNAFVYQYLEFNASFVNAVPVYQSGIFAPNCRIVDAYIIANGLTGSGANTLSFGVETDAVGYMTPTAVSVLNATPQKVTSISGILTTGKKFYLVSSGNIGGTGTAKVRVWVKMIKY